MQLGLAVDLAHLAPRYRILQVEQREGVSASGQAEDLLGFLRAFGFEAPVLIGSVPVLLAAVLQPGLVGAVVLVGQLEDDFLDVPALLQRLQSPMVTLDALEAFLEGS
ncbi:MAG TPA: hypothetical protein VGL99_30250 [Chloroflexota bacterium]